MPFFQIIGLNIELPNPIYLSLTLLYFLFILYLAHGWIRLPEALISDLDPSSLISVIIAVRNEEKNLPLLIRNLEKQTYPPDNFEVILVDDHSDTPPDSIPEVRQSKLLNLRILSLPEGKEGKKAALLEGASVSKGELLLFTDADCRMSARWISLFSGYYQNTRPDMIIGLVDLIPSKSLLSKVFRLEFLSLIAAGAASAQKKHPTLCNGANLGIKRELYLSAAQDLNLHLRSGDDVFLLHAVKRQAENQISVLKHRDAIVYTLAPSSIKHFLSQRLRWSSKSTSFKDTDTLLMAGMVFVYNCSVLGAGVGTVLHRLEWQILLIMLLVKTLGDAALLIPALRFFGGKKNILFLPLLQMIYPFYVCLTALLSQLVPYRWKNR